MTATEPAEIQPDCSSNFPEFNSLFMTQQKLILEVLTTSHDFQLDSEVLHTSGTFQKEKSPSIN